MKQLKTIVAAATLLFATSAFAKGPEKVSSTVKAEFAKSFTEASNVKWEKNADFYFASFVINETDASAAYNEKGELVGFSRVIANDQLPLNVSLAIAGKYQGYTVAKTATELTYEDQTSYYISVENDKQLLKLQCSANGDITVKEKLKK
ncbi:hypothetical protein [Ferruginibacter sp.]